MNLKEKEHLLAWMANMRRACDWLSLSDKSGEVDHILRNVDYAYDMFLNASSDSDMTEDHHVRCHGCGCHATYPLGIAGKPWCGVCDKDNPVWGDPASGHND